MFLFIYLPFIVHQEARSNVGNTAEDGWRNQSIEAMDAIGNMSVEDMDVTRNQSNEDTV